MLPSQHSALRGREEETFSLSTRKWWLRAGLTALSNLIPLKDICYKIELNHLVPTFNRMEMKRIEGLEEDEDDEEVESGLVESERQGRGLLYWATTTDISTSTTYTGTSTLASLMCTPSGFTLSECA